MGNEHLRKLVWSKFFRKFHTVLILSFVMVNAGLVVPIIVQDYLLRNDYFSVTPFLDFFLPFSVRHYKPARWILGVFIAFSYLSIGSVLANGICISLLMSQITRFWLRFASFTLSAEFGIKEYSKSQHFEYLDYKALRILQ